MMSSGSTCCELASATTCQCACASSENAPAKLADRNVMRSKPAASICMKQKCRQHSAHVMPARGPLCNTGCIKVQKSGLQAQAHPGTVERLF